MLAVVCFAWHIAINFILVLIVGGIFACCYRTSDLRYSALPLKHIDDDDEAECCLGGATDHTKTDNTVHGRLLFTDDVESNLGPSREFLLNGKGPRDDSEDNMEFEAPVRNNI